MDNEIIKRISLTEVMVKIPSVGVGTLRAPASWLIVMLAAEEPDMRPSIILEVMKHLGITIDDLKEHWADKACPRCGVSLRLHKKNGGKCS